MNLLVSHVTTNAEDRSHPFRMKSSFCPRASFLRQEINRFIRRNVLIPWIGDRIKPPKRDKINASTRLNLTAAFPACSNSPVTPFVPLYDSALPICFSRRHVVQNQYSVFCRLKRLCARISAALSIHNTVLSRM